MELTTKLVLNMELATVMLSALMMLNSLVVKLISLTGTHKLLKESGAHAVPNSTFGKPTRFPLLSPLILAK